MSLIHPRPKSSPAEELPDQQIDLSWLGPDQIASFLRATSLYGPGLEEKRQLEPGVASEASDYLSSVRAYVTENQLIKSIPKPTLDEIQELDQANEQLSVSGHDKKRYDFNSWKLLYMVEEFDRSSTLADNPLVPKHALEFASQCLVSGMVRHPDKGERSAFRDTLDALESNEATAPVLRNFMLLGIRRALRAKKPKPIAKRP